jgi:hypothetical protein
LRYQARVEAAAGETVKRFSERRRRVIGLWATLAATGFAASVRAETQNDGLPIPNSPQHDLTAIDRLFRPPPPPPVSLFPRMREEMNDAPEVVRGSTWSINPRSYYRDHATNTPTGTTISEAWAGGGSIAFESGRLFDVVSVGTVVYATFPLYAPLDRGNTGLLQPTRQALRWPASSTAAPASPRTPTSPPAATSTTRPISGRRTIA